MSYEILNELIKEKEREIVEKFFHSVLPDEEIERLAKKQIEIEREIQSMLKNDRERWIYEKGRISGHTEMILILQKKFKEFLEEIKNGRK
jgi:phosphoenolpyruvate synthase/pyruvate phosphate dikinase